MSKRSWGSLGIVVVLALVFGLVGTVVLGEKQKGVRELVSSE